MPMTGYIDTIFSALGFCNWKRAVEKFSKHERFACHRNALLMITAAKTVGMDVLVFVFALWMIGLLARRSLLVCILWMMPQLNASLEPFCYNEL